MLPAAYPTPETAVARAWQLGAELTQVFQARRELDLQGAAKLAELHALGEMGALGCASVGEIGERAGLSAEEARELCDLGRALPLTPLLEQKVRSGQIPVRAACVASRVLLHPTWVREDDDWIGWAQHETFAQVQRRVRRRIDEVRAGDEPVVPITVYVRPKGRDDFFRAREVASGKAGRALTTGETFETITDHYLDSFDFDRVTPGTRRLEPTTSVGGRYVPMAVRREIYERQGHRCAVPLCGHTLFLDRAHIVPHAAGGSREADNLLLVCSFHHDLFDTGVIRMAGTAERPTFLDRKGRNLSERWLLGGIPEDCGEPETVAERAARQKAWRALCARERASAAGQPRRALEGELGDVVEASAVDDATVDSATVDSATVDSATVDSATVDDATVDDAIMDNPPVEGEGAAKASTSTTYAGATIGAVLTSSLDPSPHEPPGSRGGPGPSSRAAAPDTPFPGVRHRPPSRA